MNFLRSLRRFYHTTTGPVSFTVNLAALSLIWLLLPLERGHYRALRAHRERYFPQINFSALKVADPLRMLIQGLYLVLFLPTGRRKRALLPTLLFTLPDKLTALLQKLLSPVATLMLHAGKHYGSAQSLREDRESSCFADSLRLALIALTVTLCAVLILWTITQPLELFYQYVFVIVMLEAALVINRFHTKYALLLMLVISVIVSSRYMFWRAGSTLNLSSLSAGFFSILLFMAECYAFLVMLLGYFQIGWTLDRKPVPLPSDLSAYPTVDIYIPTYNEPLEVVKPTVFGALDLDWPKDRLRVCILDDGTRKEFRDFAKAVGATYIIRSEHNHAKAGNINHALTVTDGELIAIFDCDHIPVRSFLQLTAGAMVADPNLALVQTPHHFYSEDPFERNLKLPRAIPQENSLFHDFIQKGNDLHDATMFCGSCALIRRKALLSVGGIAVETVTEDAHTSLRLSRKGYGTAFIGIPLAAGLSTETLSAHIAQRIRWARGMVQIFRIDNPLSGRGLSLGQRLCYLNAMIHFLHGIPRIIFLLAPLPYMFFGTYVIYAEAAAILAYVFPHMVHSTLTNQNIQRGYRFPFWSGVYEAVLSWYIALPTLIAIFFPKVGTFNVTAKGGRIEENFFDWFISKPYLILIGLNALGIVVGTIRTFLASRPEVLTLGINVLWILYNLIILGATIAIAQEARQVRRYPRVTLEVPVLIKKGVREYTATLSNYSSQGAGLTFDRGFLKGNPFLREGDSLTLIIPYDRHYYTFSCIVRQCDPESDYLGLQTDFKSLEEERLFTFCTFSRSDTWSRPRDHDLDASLLKGFVTIFNYSLYGYRVMLMATPGILRLPLTLWLRLFKLCLSFMPHPVAESPLRSSKS